MKDIKQIQEEINRLKQLNQEARSDKDATINDFMFLTTFAIRIINELLTTNTEE